MKVRKSGAYWRDVAGWGSWYNGPLAGEAGGGNLVHGTVMILAKRGT